MSVENSNLTKINSLGVKAFDIWDRKNVPFPCSPDDISNTEGLFYIKVPKTSSTTLGKITMRIAGREAKRIGLEEGKMCKTYDPMHHHYAYELMKNERRNQLKSFLWTIIRHPSNRAISHYQMRLRNGKVDSEVDSFIRNLETYGAFSPNIQLGYLLPYNDTSTIKERENLRPLVHSVMNEYNFIGTYERLYESLVVLSLLIGVSLSDVLFDFLPSEYSRCGSYEEPPWLSSGMKDYLDSDRWKDREEGDFLLYNAVNESLDLTIDKLGRDLVATELQNFKNLIFIGTKMGRSILNVRGCGIPDLHPNHLPYADIDELNWFNDLSPEDKQLVRETKSKRATIYALHNYQNYGQTLIS